MYQYYLIDNFRNNAKKWKASKAKSAAQFKNCVNEPLIDGEDHEFIIDIIYIPELHIHLGITNRLVRELNNRWESLEGGLYPFYKWCRKMNIPYENHRLVLD